MNDEQIDLEDGIEPGEALNAISYTVIGAAVEVHRVLGQGYSELIYQKAMEVELRLRQVGFVAQASVGVMYKGEHLGEGKLDLLVQDQVIVELKAVDELSPIHKAQVISYFKATRIKLKLLINFNVRKLKDGIKRIAL